MRKAIVIVILMVCFVPNAIAANKKLTTTLGTISNVNSGQLNIENKTNKILSYQLIVFALQLIVFGYQAIKLRETVASATDQTEKMGQSITQATRAADAMDRVAAGVSRSAQASYESVMALRQRSALQMRAYLTVNIGSAYYQERDKNVMFGGVPRLINTGQTPAHNVSYTASAAIYPVPLPDPELFSLLCESKPKGSAVLGPHQEFTLTALIDGFIDDNDVNNVKFNNQKALYMWGKVTYDDIFGEQHTTTFCHQIIWNLNNEVSGFYSANRNYAD